MNQNRHLMQPDSCPAFIDFEASSLDLIASYPIEVGLCLPDGALHSWLIRPNSRGCRTAERVAVRAGVL